ncbi:hypothetical protein EYF80_019888 [Liparis tanakae]|uniref:Uncharacterized protein n=1 Tax=Liparis tanakae TaxID=230148 RepID=A0A4Z2HW47_9TELE|nr:hypothetical protein EYF80_019888 [Liparis tanakae]
MWGRIELRGLDKHWAASAASAFHRARLQADYLLCCSSLMAIGQKPTEGRPYFSSSTGGLLMRLIRLQYQIMMMRMLGVRNVFMANHTLVKPPFWWMLWNEK